MMDKDLIRAMDGFTAEELESVMPREMRFELPGDALLRMQERVLERIRPSDAWADAQPHLKGRRFTKTLLIAAVVALLLAAAALAYALGGGRFLVGAFGSENYDLVKE